MRENRTSGSEGGEAQTNVTFAHTNLELGTWNVEPVTGTSDSEYRRYGSEPGEPSGRPSSGSALSSAE